MKLILTLEENGYEIRHWDEVNEEVDAPITQCWDIQEFYNQLNNLGFNITKSTLKKAIDLLENEQFVILKAEGELILN
jgi:hypothetical protein